MKDLTSSNWLMLFISLAIVIFTVYSFVGGYQKFQQNSERYREFVAHSAKSPAHKFVVDKYLSCSEAISSSRDSCVAQVITLSRVYGAEFETQVLSVVRELKLDLPE